LLIKSWCNAMYNIITILSHTFLLLSLIHFSPLLHTVFSCLKKTLFETASKMKPLIKQDRGKGECGILHKRGTRT
jgi:hypothetical protein